MGTWHPSPGVERWARKTDGSPLSGAGVKNKWSYSTNLPCPFMACTFLHINHHFTNYYQSMLLKWSHYWLVFVIRLFQLRPRPLQSQATNFVEFIESLQANTRTAHQIRLKIDSFHIPSNSLFTKNPTPSSNNPHYEQVKYYTFLVRLRNAIPYYTVKAKLCLCLINL